MTAPASEQDVTRCVYVSAALCRLLNDVSGLVRDGGEYELSELTEVSAALEQCHGAVRAYRFALFNRLHDDGARARKREKDARRDAARCERNLLDVLANWRARLKRGAAC